MLRLASFILATLILSSVVALGADVSGTWKGQLCCSEAGAYPVTLTVKAEGDKFTGSFAQGPEDKAKGRQIENGTINGDEITFSFDRPTQTGVAKDVYTGKVEGNQLK